MRTVVVVQARSGSTRLPGKVLLDLGGQTILERMLERLAWARVPDAVVVATTTDPADDAIARVADHAGFACHRGHPTDVLDRHYRVAVALGADVVVKIPSDCPLVDPRVVDRVVSTHLASRDRWDYTSNLHPESYPDGHDVEVMNLDALATAFRQARAPHEREHTTPFFWETPGRFRVQNVTWETGRDLSRTHRVVVDYGEDVEVVRMVWRALARPGEPPFSVDDLVAFLDAHPEVRLANASRFGVSWQSRRAADAASAKETR
ncbi:MAG: glycosyltransferase family protein [Polyangiaceae bacterium]|nr:glycosyltransferase family protein [Polyangiaceae bacterium]